MPPERFSQPGHERRSLLSPEARGQLELGYATYLREKNPAAAERRALRLTQTGAVSDELFVGYLRRFVYARKDKRLECVASSAGLNRLQSGILNALLLARRGAVSQARELIDDLFPEHEAQAEAWRALWFIARDAADLETSVAAGLRCLALSPQQEFRLARRVALDAERIGKATGMRRALRRAVADAKALQKRRASFRREHERIVRFWLEAYDIPRAERALALAEDRQLRKAPALAAAMARLKAEAADWLGEIEGARLDLKQRISGEKIDTNPEAVEIVLPSAMVSHLAYDDPAFRTTLRFAQGAIFDAVKATGRPIRIRSKLDPQSNVRGGATRCLVSYHTKGKSGQSLHLKESYHTGYVTLDPQGYSGWSSVADMTLEQFDLPRVEEAIAEDFFTFLQNSFVKQNVSKYAQPALSEGPQPGRYIFAPLQIINDSVQQLARVPMMDMIEELLAFCRANRITLVTKPHPRCRSPLVIERLRRGSEAGEFVVSTASVHDLIAGALAVCTVNSGVGFEALLHLKPVYLFGKADYRHACYEASTRGAFEEIFRGEATPLPASMTKRYLFWLYQNYFIDCRDKPVAKGQIAARVQAYVTQKRGAASAMEAG